MHMLCKEHLISGARLNYHVVSAVFLCEIRIPSSMENLCTFS